MNTGTIGYARLGDLRGCYHCDLHGYDAAWSPVIWTKCLTDKRNRVLVVRVDGKVVGWVSGTVSDTHFTLHRCTILPAYRRRGLCRKLIETLGPGELQVVLRLSNAVGLGTAKALGLRAVRMLKNAFEDDDGVLLIRARS